MTDFGIIKIISNGGPGMVAIVFMFMIWVQNKKKVTSNEDILKRVVTVDKKIEQIEEVVEKTWQAHNHVDEDGVYVWHIRKSMLREQAETKQVLQDLHIAIRDMHHGQERQIKVLEKLTEKLIKIT